MDKTIAAISTATGNGGIGIIRLSGKDTFDIINKIFKPKNNSKEIKGYSMKYGKTFFIHWFVIEYIKFTLMIKLGMICRG